MNGLFGQNGVMYRCINKMVDLILLNVMFLVACIPIVTIGDALVSLYSVTLKMCRNEEGYLFSSFLKYFKENFKKATIAWGIIIAFVSVIGLDFWIIKGWNPETTKMFDVFGLAMILIIGMIGSYIFPLMAKFENTIRNTFKNAMIISMTRIIHTIPVTILNLVPVFLLLTGGKPLQYSISIYLLLGFSLTAYINSFIFQIVFKRYGNG